MTDIKFAFRQLLKSPAFTAVAVLTLALGIGANTAIFSMMDALMLRMLPVADPGRLVLFGEGRAMGSSGDFPSESCELFSYPMFREMRQNNHAFTDVAAMKSMFLGIYGNLRGGDDLEKMQVQLVSGSYFPVLGIAAEQGRLLSDADDKVPGGHPVAVASHAWWTRRFGNESLGAGKTVTLGSTVYTIVGVAPNSFFGTTVGESPDFWIPLMMEAQISPGWTALNDRLFQSLHLIARLKPEVALSGAQADLNAVFKRMLQDYAGPQPAKKDLESISRARIDLVSVGNGISPLRNQFSQPLRILVVIVALVLLIACANVANLMLARAMGRQREIAIRMAVGASRWRLMRQLLIESMVLSTMGGTLGLAFAFWAEPLLVTMISEDGRRLPIEVSLDLRALAFTGVVIILTALLFGVVPSLRATRGQCGVDLKEGKGSSGGQVRTRVARVLLGSQVAIALVLLGGAFLFLRTIVNLSKIDLGFNRENVVLFGVDLSAAGYKADSRLADRYQEIEQRVAALPGIRAASFSFFTFHQGGWNDAVVTATRASGTGPVVSHNLTGSGYFATMGIPLLRGRTFGPQDTQSSPKVAVVNEAFARDLFPDRSPIGQHFHFDGTDDAARVDREIIGVVKDAKFQNVSEELRPAAYYPHAQRVQFLGDFEVRFSGDAASAIAGVRRVFAEIDSKVPLSNIRTLSLEVDRSYQFQRVTAQISAFFAAVAMFLACIGIYGVTSYWVSLQTREIGIRMALGAQRRQVISLILRQTVYVLFAGIAVGVPSVMIGQRMVASQLYGLSSIDPISIAASACLLLLAAAAAAFFPSRRATTINPVNALRND